jgi:phosphate uptake regulator
MEQEKTLQIIQDYIQEHADLFERHALEIDAILDEAMKEYDSGVEHIKQSIIDDVDTVDDPQEKMLLQIKNLEKDIAEKTLLKLTKYQEISIVE